MKYVVDTSSLMKALETLNFKEVILSSLVLQELEKHKSDHRNPSKQKAARDALHAIKENINFIEFDFNQYPTLQYLGEHYDPSYTDNKLLESLFHHQKNDRQVGLITEDLSLELQAKLFGFKSRPASLERESYQGTISICVTDHRVSEFFRMCCSSSNVHDNLFNLKIGEYLLLHEEVEFPDHEKVIGAWKWNGVYYKRIHMNQKINSTLFAEVTPKNYRQAVAIDSLRNNKITAITGKAGCGKSYLAIAYILEQIEYFERPVYIVTNNVPLREASTFGLKKGDLIDKILQSNLGSILKTKLGIDYTQQLIDREMIVPVALEDIRGSSYNSIIYITEAQNYSKDMIKTVLERLEEDGQIILDGDQRQIDTFIAKGENSGFDRLFEVYKGSGYLGHIELRGNLRGGVSKLAEKM